MFPSWQAAFDRNGASRVGFTHLLAEAKRDPRVARRLRERALRENRAFYGGVWRSPWRSTPDEPVAYKRAHGREASARGTHHLAR